MKFIAENNKNRMEFRATQPKRYYKAEARYLEKTETKRRNQIRKEKRGGW